MTCSGHDNDDGGDACVIALDMGSSSIRAIVHDAAGDPVPGLDFHKPYELTASASGAVEADADELVSLTEQCLDMLADVLGQRSVVIQAVGCSAFWHSLVGVDAAGRAVTPVFTWADTRSAECAEELRRELDDTLVHERTGAHIHPSYFPAKLRWLQTSAPDQYRMAAHWMSAAEYLYLHLLGERRVSISMASGTGIFDQARCVWDGELIETLGLSEATLSPIAEYADDPGQLRSEYARRWPSLAGIPWYLPLGDGACNNVGSGATDERSLALMVGTSGAMRVIRRTDDVVVPAGLWSYRLDRQRVVQGGALSEGGRVFAWLNDTMQVPEASELERDLASMPPDAHGLTMLAFFAGERSPHWDPRKRATLHGMTFDTSSVEIVRAALESIALRFGLIHQVLGQLVSRTARIVGSGAGLIHSPTWMQIMADVLGRPITTSAVLEASSRGAAMMALDALGTVGEIGDFAVPVGSTYEPISSHTLVYRTALERQLDLERRLAGFHSDQVGGL